MQNKSKNQNTPILRFPEFSGEWKERNLGDVSDVRDGTHDSPKYCYHGLPLVTSKNLKKDGGINFMGAGLISKEDFIQINKRSKVNTGDILFGMIGTIGNPVIVQNENFAIKNVALIKELNDLKNKYLYQYLKSNYTEKQFYRINAGGTQKFIALGQIRNLKIPVPVPKEQQKIASFLRVVDEWTSNLRAQKDELVDYKKGMMQKIFSQEFRFKDDNGKNFPEWDEKRLVDIGQISTSSVDKKTNGNEKMVSLLNYMDVYRRDRIFQNDNFQTVSAKDSQIFSSNLKQGDVLFTPSSETPDDIGHSAVAMEDLKNVLFSYHLVRFRPDKNILDFNFSAYAFKSFKFYKNLWRMAQGATRFTLSKDAFESSKIGIPKSMIEQQKIAEFLTSIDSLIESKQQQIAQAELWKKGLMQGLFV